MKGGTGRKTKIFEMLALGIPIFTNIDLSEYGLKNNKHYKIFNKKKSIKHQIKSLLSDEKLRKKISTNAYNWSRKYSFYEKAFAPINKIL